MHEVDQAQARAEQINREYASLFESINKFKANNHQGPDPRTPAFNQGLNDGFQMVTKRNKYRKNNVTMSVDQFQNYDTPRRPLNEEAFKTANESQLQVEEVDQDKINQYKAKLNSVNVVATIEPPPSQ